jgi:hypothetical protein
MMVTILPLESSVLATATRRHIPEDEMPLAQKLYPNMKSVYDSDLTIRTTAFLIKWSICYMDEGTCY